MWLSFGSICISQNIHTGQLAVTVLRKISLYFVLLLLRDCLVIVHCHLTSFILNATSARLGTHTILKVIVEYANVLIKWLECGC